MGIVGTAGLIVVLIIVVGMIFSRLYTRASKEISFVRTGAGGQKIVMNGGALVFPVLHETIPVNMNTLRLEVRRANEQALITRDRMRVDVLAEFYVRVQPTSDSIAAAAQTLGRRTMEPTALKDLVEGKFVDALRAVAAEMTMEELHEQRVDFVQKVQHAVSEDLLKNGLELESVSLTGLDQTNKEFFNPDNAFDAAGLTKLTEEIEDRRKRRNDIEQDTRVMIELKNLEAQQKSLQISRDTEYATLEQQREVEVRKASQASDIASQQAGRRKEAEEAQILADREVDLARIEKERLIREKDIERERSVEVANQERDIIIAEKSKEQAAAQADADRARADAVKAEEQVVTARETEISERQKAIELIEARKVAERDAIAIQVKAEAGKLAAEDESEAIRTLAEARASETRIVAEGDAEAEKLRADAAEKTHTVEAAGRAAMNDADNRLSAEIVNMKVKLALVEQLQAIIRESVKPMEAIDSIKILQVDGLGGGGNGVHGGETVSGGGMVAGSPSDGIVQSALKYRAQAPLIDSLLQELGLGGSDPASLSKALAGAAFSGNKVATAKKAASPKTADSG